MCKWSLFVELPESRCDCESGVGLYRKDGVEGARVAIGLEKEGASTSSSIASAARFRLEAPAVERDDAEDDGREPEGAIPATLFACRRRLLDASTINDLLERPSFEKLPNFSKPI